MVARRLIPLVVAFAMAFAPLALEACEASCLSYAVEAAVSISAHHHHSHSGLATPAGPVHHGTETQGFQSSAVIASQSHACDHDDDVPAFAAAQNDVLAAPAIQVSTFEYFQIQPSALPALDTIAAPAAKRITLTTQLRV